MPEVLLYAVVTVAAFVGMEGFAWAAHRYVMHGWGWGWHRSHHEPREGAFEKNDLYAVVFAVFATGLFWVGALPGLRWVWFLALGITLYGIMYAFVHDGLVHQRWPFTWFPKRGYFRRLVQAHKLHHATQGKEGAVSFGFLYAPDPQQLKERLRANKQAVVVDRAALDV
jgi:beta-carotene 3-hydroxylase